jgi:hypothetical protein
MVPLFVWFSSTLSETNPRAAAVLVNEFDASGFECASNYIKSRAARLANPSLNLLNLGRPCTALA